VPAAGSYHIMEECGPYLSVMNVFSILPNLPLPRGQCYSESVRVKNTNYYI
jgi:hypothetical protein